MTNSHVGDSDSDSSYSEDQDQDLCQARKYLGKRTRRQLRPSPAVATPEKATSEKRVLRSRVGQGDAQSSSVKSTQSAAPAIDEAAPDGRFQSCLFGQTDEVLSPINLNRSPRLSSSSVLKRAISTQELDDESWLSSPFISLVITKFAKRYEKVRFFAADFVGLPLSESEYRQVTDILGRRFDFADQTTPLVFLLNNNNIHWNLLRVVRGSEPELQLFEPLGLPSRSNRVGLSLRAVPKVIVDWLDNCFPLPSGDSWLTTGISAITSPHQLTNYDCGVACLLYAEKCGNGETKEQINAQTTQEDITEYREMLKIFLARVQERSGSFDSI